MFLRSEWKLSWFGHRNERAVRPSTLLALFRHCLACSLSSVWYLLYLRLLICCRSNWTKFIASWVSKGIPRQWRFVQLTCLKWSRLWIIFLVAMIVTGFASSERIFNFHPLLGVLPDWYLTVILTLRAWAVWNRNQRLAVILPILYTCIWSSNFVFLGIFLNSVTCKQSALHS